MDKTNPTPNPLDVRRVSSLARLRAFFTGMREFRSDFTAHFPHDPFGELARAYDLGRDLAHRLTLRRWDSV